MLQCDFEYRRNDFQLQVKLELDRQILGIMGPSGAGKTTLLHNIAGLLQPAQGSIRFNGAVLSDAASRTFIPMHQRRIALILQNALLFPHMNVRQNLLYSPQAKNLSGSRFALDEIIDILEIRPLLQRKAHQLSGGEAQRVSIGRALMSSPNLLLLDEPLSGLNAQLKLQIISFLKQIHQQYRLPMLYVSHHVEELSALNAAVHLLER